MRWKANLFLRGEDTINEHKENYGFKTRLCPTQCPELEEFEKDLLNIVKNIKFKRHYNLFQSELKQDIEKIKTSKHVFILADKANNIYEVEPDHYKKLLRYNITKTYKKSIGHNKKRNQLRSQINSQ